MTDKQREELKEKGIAVPELAKFQDAKYKKGISQVGGFLAWLKKEGFKIQGVSWENGEVDSLIYRYCQVDEKKVKADREKILKAFGDPVYFLGNDNRAYPI